MAEHIQVVMEFAKNLPFQLMLLALFASALGTYCVLRYARACQILDVPNDRSLHTVPTPRGGGLGLVLGTVLCSLLWEPQLPELWYACMTGLLIAGLGWWDDRFSLPVRWRLGAQIGLSTLFVVLCMSLYPQDKITFVFCVLSIVWMSNLYNFMDGSDGIAATQVLTVSVALATLFIWKGILFDAVLFCILAFASLGFLIFNWQPARIFMGDVGSVFLGFYLSSLAIMLAARSGRDMFWIIMAMSASFIVDATYTLIVRLLRGEKVYQAHRSHAYQKLIQKGWSHARVACLYGALNLLWVAPVVFILHTKSLLWMVLLVGLPQLGLNLWTRAGIAWKQS